MMTELYDHRNGRMNIPPGIIEEITQIFSSIEIPLRRNGVKGIKDAVLGMLYKKGWTEELLVNSASKITITSFQNGVGLCLQTGNAARIYADLLKLQTLFISESIRAGIILLPSRDAALKLGDNVVNFERVTRELAIFKQVITMPIVVIGFNEKGI